MAQVCLLPGGSVVTFNMYLSGRRLARLITMKYLNLVQYCIVYKGLRTDRGDTRDKTREAKRLLIHHTEEVPFTRQIIVAQQLLNCSKFITFK